jgi:hypothetical protein
MSTNFDQSFLKSIFFIHEVKIFNEIQNKKKIIIFDLRKRDEYNKCFLEGSINIPYNEYDYEFFETFNESTISGMTSNTNLKEKILRYKRYFIAIIMSEKKIKRKDILELNSTDDEAERIKKCLLFYKSLIRNKVREIGLFNKGFERISKDYYFLVNNLYCSPTFKLFVLI